MPFNFEELATQLENLAAEERAWIFVVGCAPQSLRCPEPTQRPTGLIREKPIDFHADPEGLGDFLVLKHALNLKVRELEALERSFGEEKIKELNELEKQLEGKEIEELSRAFEARARVRS